MQDHDDFDLVFQVEFDPPGKRKGRARANLTSGIIVWDRPGNVVTMKKPKLAITSMDKSIAELASRTNHRRLAVWAADCAERVLPYLEERYPEDNRPRKAIEAARAWAQTGVFRMADIRKIALATHAAAREVKDEKAACSAARAAGHALATAHVRTHAIAAAMYTATALRDAVEPAHAEVATDKEREWQLQHLLNLSETKPL